MQCLALIPILGFILYPIGLIPAIMVFVYNVSRREKVGIRRVIAGLVVGGLGVALTLFMIGRSRGY